jgi:hypothetical protein
MNELMQMCTSELVEVNDFTIEEPRFGKIEFIGPTDLTGVDLEEDITIDATGV